MSSIQQDVEIGNQFDINRQTAKLLRHLWRGGQWAHYWRAADRRSLWFPVDNAAALPADWRAKHNVYFTVNPVSDARERSYKTASTNATVAAINCLFAEYDGKDFIRQDEWLPHYQEPTLDGLSPAKARGALQKAQTAAIDAAYKLDPDGYKARAWAHILALPVRPSVVVKSGGGYQCYWLLAATVPVDDANRAQIAHVQREWVHLVGGDKSACDLRRVLRVPGTHNVKPKYAPDYPLVAFAWCELDRLYDYADLAEMVPAQRTPIVRTRTYVPPHVDLPEVDSVPDLPACAEVTAYNRETDLRTQLLEIGYSEHPSGRLSRPGGDSGGVELHPSNRARIYSTADPLFCDRLVSPADVLCIYEFGGDAAATVAHLQGLYADRLATLHAAKLWVRTHSFAPYVPVDLQATRWQKDESGDRIAAGVIYRTDATDTKIADAVLDIMAQQAKTEVTCSLRRIAKLAGVTPATVLKTLPRLGNWLFDYTLGAKGTPDGSTFALAQKFVAVTLNTSALSGADAEVFNLTATNEYSPRKADDPFLTGTSHYMRDVLRDLAAAAGKTPAEIRDLYTVPALGETVLRVLDALGRCGEMTRAELCTETGKRPSAIATATLRLERLGLLAATRAAPRDPKVYELLDDVWGKIDDLRPTLRTDKLSTEREDDQLRGAQAWCLREMDTAAPDRRAELKKRFTQLGNKRLPLLAKLHPGLTQEELAGLAFEQPADRPNRGLETERRRRLSHAYVAGERAENRPPQVKTTAGERWRRQEYAKTRAEAEAHWPDFAAWAEARHGAKDGRPWWALLSQTDVIGLFKQWQIVKDYAPTVHWAGAEVAA